MGDIYRLTAVAHGLVQGVYFRNFVQGEALKRGLSGYAFNRADGRSVEVAAEGPRAELEGLLECIHAGPPAARVDSVDVEWSDGESRFVGFRVG